METENVMRMGGWNGYRKWKWYRKLEWVQENGMDREKCYGTENGIDTGSWNTYRKWNQ